VRSFIFTLNIDFKGTTKALIEEEISYPDGASGREIAIALCQHEADMIKKYVSVTIKPVEKEK